MSEVLGDYAIYLRKSRADIEAEEKGEGETLARHEHILLELANKKCLKIGKIYKEIVSGETIEARPEMKKLLSDVKNGTWKGVLVVEVERLARGETMDQGIVAKTFKISNTKIITPMKTYNPNNEFDEEYFEFGLFMSRREYKIINRRLQIGREMSVKEGKYVGSIAPFGYDRVKIKNGKGYTLRRNSEADTVKIIFDLYAYNNLSINEITKKLNEMGLKPRKNNKWSYFTVKDILSNPVYIGKVKWNFRKEIKTYKNEKLVKIRPRNNNYLLIDGLHKPIIDEKTWEITSAKRKLNSAPIAKKYEIQNPLCGLIICGKCGKKMKRRAYSKKDKEPTLYCDNPDCDNVSSKFYYVEEKIIYGLNKWLEQYKFDFEEYLKKIDNDKLKSIEEMILMLKQELKKENEKLLVIFDFLEDGTYTKEIFNSRQEKILSKIEKINSSILKYEESLNQEKILIKKREKLLPKVSNVMGLYNLLKTPEEKNNFLKVIVNKITYLKTEKSIRKNSDPTKFIISIYPKINKTAHFLEQKK